jgi:superfamily II helicase
MATQPFKKRPEIERRIVERELAQGRITLIAQIASLSFAVVFTVCAIVLAVMGADWRLVATVAAAGAASGRAAVHRTRRD